MSEKLPSKENQETDTQRESPEQTHKAASKSSPDEVKEKALAELAKGLAEIKAGQESVGTSKAEVNAIKAEIKTAHESIGADLTSFTELKSRVTGLINEAENKAKQFSLEHESLGTQIDELKKLQQELKDFLEASNKIKSEVEASREAVATAEQSVNQTKERFDELATGAQASNAELTNRQNEANAKASEIETLFNRTKQQYDSLFTDEIDANENVVKKSVNTQIQELHSGATKKLTEMQRELVRIQDALSDMQDSTKKEIQQLRDDAEGKMTELSNQSKEKFENLYKELKSRIESLLPGAGAAGLASTYFDAKEKYGFTPLKIGVDNEYPVWTWITHYGKTLVVTLFFYGMFLAPLGGIAYIFWQIIEALAAQHDNNFSPNLFFLRLLITIPLGIISGFGWASIRLYRRMYEEYNYKQRVMQLYHSFKGEIAENGTHEQKQALLSIMLGAVGAKPDLGMHEDEGMIRAILDKIPGLPGGKPQG